MSRTRRKHDPDLDSTKFNGLIFNSGFLWIEAEPLPWNKWATDAVIRRPYSKGLKKQTKKARRCDWRADKMKIMKNSEYEPRNREKYYLGFIWD